MKNHHLLRPRDFRWGGDFWKMFVRFALLALAHYYYMLFALTIGINPIVVYSLLGIGWGLLAYVSYLSVKE